LRIRTSTPVVVKERVPEIEDRGVVSAQQTLDRGGVLISPAELASALDEEQLVVIDVSVAMAAPSYDGDYRAESGAGQWRRQRIPGSVHVDLLTEFVDARAPYHFGRPAPGAVREGLTRLGVGAGTRIVLYDDGTMQWAARAWWMLRDAGVEARVLDGGLAKWLADGEAVEHGEPAGRPRRGGAGRPLPEPAGDRGLWADKQEVREISLGLRPGTLVCALSAGHFAGTEPTRYTRRGHIPGSVNLPSKDLAGADRALLPAGRLSELAAAALAGARSPLVIYCGGGISAALTALALTLDGRRDVKVYDGSLEEWTADLSLPVATAPGAPR
jgi:thiosulfate/3-mercaptopyruvate sulfurtransferase